MEPAVDLAQSALLLQLIAGNRITQALYVAVKLGIPDLLSKQPQRSDELAPAAGAHAPSLYRLLRAVASLGVLHEDAEHRFRLTPLGERLRSDIPASLRPMVLLFGEPFWWQVMGGLLDAVRSGRAAVPHLHGTDLWTYLEHHPEQAAIFNDAMATQTERQIPSILAAYDFTGIRSLVDVGGGRGVLLAALLRHYDQMHGILLDTPRVLADARSSFAPPDVAGRARLLDGDMFAGLPEGADAYLLKLILHDWSDDQAVHVLTNVRRAMPAWGKLLLCEHVVSSGNDQEFSKLLDLSMLLLGGRERTAGEWERLLSAARLHLVHIIPTQAQLCVIEAQPA